MEGIVRYSSSTNSANGDMLFDYARNSFFNLYAGGVLSIRSVQFAITGTSNTGYHEFNFDGGTLCATPNSANLVFMQGLAGCYIRSGGATIDTTNVNITIAQALLDGGGDGGLTKRGSGTLTLTGTNNYTGTTVVNNGTLMVNQSHAAAGTVTVATGAALGFLSDAPGATAHISSATVNGKLAVAFTGQTGVPASAAGQVDTLNLNGTVAVNVTSLPAGLSGGGTIPLIHYDTLTGSGSVTTGQLPSGVTGTVFLDAANHLIKITTAATAAPKIGSVSVAGGNFLLSGSGGPTGGGQSYYVLSSTNVAAAMGSWVPVATNLFNTDGTFNASLPISSTEPRRFYLLQLP